MESGKKRIQVVAAIICKDGEIFAIFSLVC